MSNPAVFPVTVSANELAYNMVVDAPSPYAMSVDTAITLVEGDPYDGDYEFTPSAETQVIYTKDKTPTDNIIINPIPNNYGLITWNGVTLTVS